MPNTINGKRATDGWTFTNVIRGFSSIAGIVALVAVLWSLPSWVTATDNKIEVCQEKIQKLEAHGKTIQELKVDVEVTKTKVENISREVESVNTTVTEIARKQDKLMEFLLKDTHYED